VFIFHSEGALPISAVKNVSTELIAERLLNRRFGFRCKVKGLLKTKPIDVASSIMIQTLASWFLVSVHK
jgi:hypothetical protein